MCNALVQKARMLIIDDLHAAKGGESVDMAGIVKTLRAGKAGRIVLAYLDIGAVGLTRPGAGKKGRVGARVVSTPGSAICASMKQLAGSSSRPRWPSSVVSAPKIECALRSRRRPSRASSSRSIRMLNSEVGVICPAMTKCGMPLACSAV